MSDYNEFLSLWTSSRLKEVCRVLYLFTRYLLKPREGYKPYNVIYISPDVTKYVIEDIFGCTLENHNTLYTENFQRLVRDNLHDCFIENDVYDHLWNYITSLQHSLTDGISPEDIFKSMKVKINEENVYTIINTINELKKRFDTEFLRLKNDDYIKRKYKFMKLSNEERFILSKMGVDNEDLVKLEGYSIFQNDALEKTEKNKYWKQYKLVIKNLSQKILDTLETVYSIFINNKIYEYLLETGESDPSKQFRNLKEKKKLESFVGMLKDIREEDILKKSKENALFLLKRRVEENVKYVSNIEGERVLYDDDFDNCFMNAVIYLLVTVSDWLETIIGEDEIKVVISILLPEDKKIHIDKTISDDNETFNKFLSQQLEINGVEYDSGYFYLISETLKSINQNVEIREMINNRVRFFSDNRKKLL